MKSQISPPGRCCILQSPLQTRLRMGGFAQQIIKASAAMAGGQNHCVPSQPRPSAIPRSHPPLSPSSPPWAPSPGQCRMQYCTAGCWPLLYFSCIQGTRCPLVHWAWWLWSTGVSGDSGLSLPTPPSFHAGAAGCSFGCTYSSTKGHKNQRVLPPEQSCVEASGDKKGFPKPKNTRGCWAAPFTGPTSAVLRLPPQKTTETALQWKNEISEQHLPSPKHHVGIPVSLLLQSSLIYPKSTSLPPNSGELHRVISNAMNGHHGWADDTVPSPHARQSFPISLHRQCVSAAWNDVPCSFHVQTVKREGKKITGSVLPLKWSPHKVLTFQNNLVSAAGYRIYSASDADAALLFNHSNLFWL